MKKRSKASVFEKALLIHGREAASRSSASATLDSTLAAGGIGKLGKCNISTLKVTFKVYSTL